MAMAAQSLFYMICACVSPLAGVHAIALDSGSARHAGNATRRPGLQQEADRDLLICNAYAYPRALDIRRVRAQRNLTEKGALRYKECRHFTVPLREGDQIAFKAGHLNVGTFHATGLPPAGMPLVLVPHRRHPGSIAASFRSHAFADVRRAQLAVMDAYNGRDAGKLRATRAAPGGGAAAAAVEDLPLDSVVMLEPGSYTVALLNSTGAAIASVPLSIAGPGRYLAMRVGSGPDGGDAPDVFPQDLLVFSEVSEASEVQPRSHAAAPWRSPCAAALLLAAGTLALSALS